MTVPSRLGGAIALLVMVSGGCAAPSTSPTPAIAVGATAPHIELTIYAAASLEGVLDAAARAYAQVDATVVLTISTDSSSALETKIEQGAPADLLLSADTTNPQKLADKSLTVGPPVNFARNKLTVITPKDNPGKIQTPKDLANTGVKIIAAGDAVPITKYATQLVANLAKQPGYPMNYVTAYNANIASKEENVSGIVTKVATGEGDAGIGYVTDAMTNKDVATVDVPADANVIATYAGVVVKTSPNPDAANTFLTWFAGPDGQAILSSFGFLPPT
jgi:molybdate transport system substrate-binding protein